MTDIRPLARALVEKLDECLPGIESAFAFQWAHGIEYSGPQYGEALEALRAALSQPIGQEVVERRAPTRRREEANAILPLFSTEWQLLRFVADQVVGKSACQLVSRARDLEDRGLVESRWYGTIKEWRRTAAIEAMPVGLGDGS